MRAQRLFPNPRNDKARLGRALRCSNMAEAMGFELLYKVQPNTSSRAITIALSCTLVNINESGLSANEILP